MNVHVIVATILNVYDLFVCCRYDYLCYLVIVEFLGQGQTTQVESSLH